MVKKKLLTALVVGFCICGGQTLNVVPTTLGVSVAEARTNSMQVGVMERELKKQKKSGPYEGLNQRLHEAIMGLERPRKEDRVRIAVIVAGDENMVVEDRVKNQVYSRLREKFPIDYFAVYKGTDVNSKLLQYAEDIYYDQREYATTRDTVIDAKKTSNGINVSINGQKDITDAKASAGASDGSDSASASASGSGDSHWFGGTVGVSVGSNSVYGEENRVTKSSRVDVDGIPVGNRPRNLADMRRMDYVRAGRECNYDYVFVLTMSNGKGKIYNHDFLVTGSNTVTKNIWLRVRLVDVKSGNYLYRNDIPAMGKTHNGHINGKVLERSVAKAMQEAMDDIRISER